MRLSDAIGMGRTIQDGGDGWHFCDCGLGMGMAAMGVVAQERTHRKAIDLWPWIWPKEMDIMDDNLPIHKISSMYFSVARGERTLDELIDWVRSVEPAEEQIPIAQESHEAVTAKA